MRCDFLINNIQVSGRVHLTNRTNRSNRQPWTTPGSVVSNEMRFSAQQNPFRFVSIQWIEWIGRIDNVEPPGLLSVMRCDFPIDNIQVSGRVHSTNRTNQWNRQRWTTPGSVVSSLFRWNLLDSIGHECWSQYYWWRWCCYCFSLILIYDQNILSGGYIVQELWISCYTDCAIIYFGSRVNCMCMGDCSASVPSFLQLLWLAVRLCLWDIEWGDFVANFNFSFCILLFLSFSVPFLVLILRRVISDFLSPFFTSFCVRSHFFLLNLQLT